MPLKDRAARNELSRLYYHKNRERLKAAHLVHYQQNRGKYFAAVKKNKERLRQWMMEVKDDGPCADCKTHYPPYVLDFDHVRGKKLLSVSEMVERCYGKKKILEEIEKCELVCANCHRERTHKRKVTP